jgi:hypothetical protein
MSFLIDLKSYTFVLWIGVCPKHSSTHSKPEQIPGHFLHKPAAPVNLQYRIFTNNNRLSRKNYAAMELSNMIQFLGKLPLLTPLSEAELEDLAKIAYCRRAPKFQFIYIC